MPVITFNVVFTPGTPARLLPFARSLLQGEGVRVRLVANGCGPEDADLLKRAAQADERVSHHGLPQRHTVEHGLALNHVFAAFPDEPEFAFADSDVIASGDFMRRLLPMAPGEAAVSAAAPAWATRGDLVVPPRWPLLSGRLNSLEDGTPVGGTYLAVYDRAAVEPLWREAPHGFAVHHWHSVPRRLRRALSARGWRFRYLDTCRLVNLQLLLAGHTLGNRDIAELHHVGGFSGPSFWTRRSLLGSVRWSGRAPGERRFGRIADQLAFRVYLTGRLRHPRFRRLNDRRSAVRSYIPAVLDAMLAGEPPPPALKTDSAEVDRRVAALVEAIRAQWPPQASGV